MVCVNELNIELQANEYRIGQPQKSTCEFWGW